MKKKTYIIALSILLICLISLGIFFKFKKNCIWNTNEASLKTNILTSTKNEDIIDLSTFTPFQWDVAYSFEPYISKEKIYEIVGYKWDNITETVSEGMNQLVFLKDKKVVCYVYGYGYNNKYYINLGNTYTKGYITLFSKDSPKFKVKIENSVTSLNLIE